MDILAGGVQRKEYGLNSPSAKEMNPYRKVVERKGDGLCVREIIYGGRKKGTREQAEP